MYLFYKTKLKILKLAISHILNLNNNKILKSIFLLVMLNHLKLFIKSIIKIKYFCYFKKNIIILN